MISYSSIMIFMGVFCEIMIMFTINNQGEKIRFLEKMRLSSSVLAVDSCVCVVSPCKEVPGTASGSRA